MLQLIALTALFSLSTVVSILLLGSRSIVGGDMTGARIVHILLSWQFILGAVFAFAARLFFLMINNVLFKIPHLSASSTTVTTLISNVALLFVIAANYLFLDERLSPVQGIGSALILLGVFLVAR
jgi:drug/metabolite transporter (DMT)-like permease